VLMGMRFACVQAVLPGMRPCTGLGDTQIIMHAYMLFCRDMPHARARSASAYDEYTTTSARVHVCRTSTPENHTTVKQVSTGDHNSERHIFIEPTAASVGHREVRTTLSTWDTRTDAINDLSHARQYTI
jgi:hypothetical protein